MGWGGKRRERDFSIFFDAGRCLQGSAEQLSIADKWLSSESAVFKAPFGQPTPGPAEQTCNRADGYHRLINACQSPEKAAKSWIQIQGDREGSGGGGRRGLQRDPGDRHNEILKTGAEVGAVKKEKKRREDFF